MRKASRTLDVALAIAVLAVSSGASAVEPRWPRRVGALPGYAIVVTPDAVFANGPDGLRVWRRPAPGAAWGRPRRFGPKEGMRDAGIVVDGGAVYTLASEKLWRAPVPAATGAVRPPVALADTGETTALAGDGDALYFAAADAMQVFRVARTGGGAAPLVTSGAAPATLTPGARDGPQGLVVDGDAVYWTFEGKILRVAKTGGAVRELARAQKLAGPSLALDGDFIYWGAGGKTHRAAKQDGSGARAILNFEAQAIRLQRGALFAIGGAALVRSQPDGAAPEPLDDCARDKVALAISGDRVFWSDEDYGYAEPGVFELALLPEAAAPARSGRPSADEAGRAARVWLRALADGRPTPTLAAPLVLRLERGLDYDDEFVLEREVRTPAELDAVAGELRRRRHDLLSFTARCPAWVEADRRVRAETARGRAPARDAITIVSHWNRQCPFAEVVATMKRVGGAVVPTHLVYRTGYDCE